MLHHSARQNPQGVDEQAYMGIGTLIVFIAVLLVAAVVCAVLIFSAQVVKQQAERTTVDTVYQVSCGLDIVTMMGDRNVNGSDTAPTSDLIQVLELTVTVKPGSPDIRLDDVTVYIMHGEQAYYLAYDRTAPPNASYATNSTYVARIERDPDASFIEERVINAGDLITLLINMGPTGTAFAVGPQDKLTVRLIPRMGSVYYEEIIVQPYVARYVELI
jgi:flagellin FlaB